jgi:hypothetical protein
MRGVWIAAVMAAGLAIGAAPPAAAQTSLPEMAARSTAWSGELSTGAAKLEVQLRLVQEGAAGPSLVLDVPAQGATGLQTRNVSFADGRLRFELAAAPASFEGAFDADGRLVGAWTQGGASLPLVFTPGQALAVAKRPQEPAQPLPYPSEDVQLAGAGGVTLACTFARPAGSGKAPAVVLLTGSGAQDRNETLLGHKPFLVLSDALARRGVASLRCDDRGVGGSGGSLRTARMADLVADARAMAAKLKSLPGVNPARVGCVGHSEGGIIAPAAAAGQKGGPVVLLAGPATPLEQVLREQLRALLLAEGGTEEAIAAAAKPQAAVIEGLRAAAPGSDPAPSVQAAAEAAGVSPDVAKAQAAQFGTPLMRDLLEYDPAPTLAALRRPVLALFGGKDAQVPAGSNGAAATAALARNRKAEVRVMEGLNHLFQPAVTGGLSEYMRIETTMAPEALDAISAFILKH